MCERARLLTLKSGGKQMEKMIKVRVKYRNVLSMPITVNKKVTDKELEELLAREDIEIVLAEDRKNLKKIG